MVSEMWGLTVSIHGQIKRTNNVCHSVIKHRQMFDRRAFLVRDKFFQNIASKLCLSSKVFRCGNMGKESNVCPPCTV